VSLLPLISLAHIERIGPGASIITTPAVQTARPSAELSTPGDSVHRERYLTTEHNHPLCAMHLLNDGSNICRDRRVDGSGEVLASWAHIFLEMCCIILGNADTLSVVPAVAVVTTYHK